MNKKLFKLLTAGALLLLSACGDNVMESSDSSKDPVQTTATLNVLVKDAITNASLRASVKLSTGAQDSTNATSGIVYFKGVPIGEHRAIIEKTGYASVVLTPRIGSYITDNIAIARDTSVNATLYPQNAGLEGYVLFEDKSGKSKPPTNATVRFIATATQNLVDNVFEVPVSATDGKFVFANLPALGTSYALQVLDATADGQVYAAREFAGNSLVSLMPKTTVYVKNSIKYTANDLVALFELTNFSSVIKSKDTLKLEFSDSIDAGKFKPDMITFGNTVTTVVEKIVKGKTLNLVPADKWPSSFTFYISNIVSAKGTTYSIPSNNAKTVYVNGIFELVSYKTTVKGKEPLVLEFSDSIDATKFRDGMVTLSNSIGNSIVAEKIVDGKTLKLIPADNWPNSFTFTIGGGSATAANNIISVNGMTYYTSAKTIYMEGIFELVGYKTTVKSKDTLVLEFSDTIDAVKFKSNMISFANYSGTLPTLDMRVEDKQIKLIPSGNWPAPSFEFSFSSSNPILSVKGVANSTPNTNKKVYLEGNFDIVSYTNLVKPTDIVFIEFSDSIDAARFRPSQVSATLNNGVNVDCNKIVDGKKIKLVPIGTEGRWPTEGFNFTVNSSLLSVRGIPATSTTKPVSIDGYFSYISHGPIPLATTDTLVVEFNYDVDTNGIYKNVVSTTSPYSNNGLNINWDAADGKKLKITPKNQSRWNANSNFTLYFNYDNTLKSLNGLKYIGDPSKSITVKTYTFNGTVVKDILDPSIEADVTSPIIIEFTDTILASELSKPNSVRINSSNDIVFDKEIVDGKKLKLALIAGSKWPYNSAYFNINLNLKSVNNVWNNSNLPINIKLRTDLASVKVTNLGIVKSGDYGLGNYRTPDTLNYNSTSTYLTWKRVPFVGYYNGAVNYNGGYRIYKREGTGTTLYDYSYTGSSAFSSMLVGSDTIYYTYVSWASNALADNKNVEFFVVAYNDSSMGSMIEATKLTLRDGRAPSVYNATSSYYVGDDAARFGTNGNSASTNSYQYSSNISSYIYNLAYYIYYYNTSSSGYNNPRSYNCDNPVFNGSSYVSSSCYYGLDSLQFGFYSDLAYHLANAGAKTNAITGCTNFNEPMDTTAVLTEAGLPSRVSVAKEWKTDERTLCFTFNVAEGDPSTDDIATTYSISGLKDKGGNALDITYGTGLAATKRNTLDFRIKSIGYRDNYVAP